MMEQTEVSMLIIEKSSNERNIDDAELKVIIRHKITLAEHAMEDGDFQTATREFKDAAAASFELGDFETAMLLLDRHEAASKQRVVEGSRITVYLADLEKKVDQAMKLSRYGQARDFLKQMLAIAEQGRDVPAIKAIKQRLAQVQGLVMH